jgi:hypothetical protein
LLSLLQQELVRKQQKKSEGNPLNNASKQVTIPDAVEKKVQYAEIKETHEVDFLIQYCEKIFVSGVHYATCDKSNALVRSNALETGETCETQLPKTR